MINDKSQPKSPIEQLFDQRFSEPTRISKKEQMKHAAQEVAEALWEMFAALRDVGFSESQAMYLCAQMLTSQGGE